MGVIGITPKRNHEVGEIARPHPNLLPLGEGGAFCIDLLTHRLVNVSTAKGSTTKAAVECSNCLAGAVGVRPSAFCY